MQRILLVEDNADLADGLQRNLEVEGYDVRIAHRAAEALALAAQEEYDLVVLDLGLPDMDGFHVLRQLRARGSLTPVLILSARGLETDKVEGFRLGADDYVTKPFGVMELLARVSALLRRVRAMAGAGGAAAEAPADLSDEVLRERYALTNRQIAVARLLGEGCTNTEIAERLCVSAFTARNHTEQVLAKLGVSTRARVGAVLRGRA
ncbi:MAG TPA: response regulator [Longimicrobiaceae bacterium]|nr:response regulator [Longimicrobiaceae bacterium]